MIVWTITSQHQTKQPKNPRKGEEMWYLSEMLSGWELIGFLRATSEERCEHLSSQSFDPKTLRTMVGEWKGETDFWWGKDSEMTEIAPNDRTRRRCLASILGIGRREWGNKMWLIWKVWNIWIMWDELWYVKIFISYSVKKIRKLIFEKK